MLEKLYDRVRNDYDEYIANSFKDTTKEDLLNNAFELYHAQNFFWQVEFMLENAYCVEDIPITTIAFNNMLNYSGNVVEFYIENRYEFRHSERYNYEDYDDFISILNIVMGELLCIM